MLPSLLAALSTAVLRCSSGAAVANYETNLAAKLEGLHKPGNVHYGSVTLVL